MRFPIILWLVSIILGPTLMVIWGLWVSDFRWVLDDFTMYLIFVIVGALFSLPTLAVCIFTYKVMGRKGYGKQEAKMGVSLVSLLGVWASFIFVFGWESFEWAGNRSGIIYSVIYSTSIVLASLGIHLFKKRQRP